MQEKEVFLKKNKYTLFLLFFILINSCSTYSNTTNYKDIIVKYFSNIENFSSSFIQSDGISVEEGMVYLKKDINRIKIDYTKPTNISIVLSKKKAMYLNIDLKEVEYFNPNNSIASVFFKIFYDESFFHNSIINEKKSTITLAKNIKDKDSEYKIKILFEKNPLLIKKIQIQNNDQKIDFGLVGPDFNSELQHSFFSLANPLLN